MLKLNSISKSVYDAYDIKDNPTIEVRSNSGDGMRKISRKELVAYGRIVACERIGELINGNAYNKSEKFNSLFKDKGANYDRASLARRLNEDKMLFCAACACAVTHEPAPKTFEEFVSRNSDFAHNQLFLQTLSAIDTEIIRPIYFDVISDVSMGLMQWEPMSYGATKELKVKSNDVFLWQDSSFGSVRSTPRNWLYGQTVTLNPTPKACNASLKWYQDIVNGDAGDYYAASMLGLYSKIYAQLISKLNTAVADGSYIPSDLTAQTYTTGNWNDVTTKVAAANGLRVKNLMAIGTRQALSAVLPVDSTGGAITGLQYGLGEMWFENGFLPNAGGVDLFEVTPAIVPGTQNSTVDTIDTGDNIYILAKGLYKPMYGAYFAGSPITLTATPNGGDALGTGDLTIDINCTSYYDIQPVFASKVGVIGSAYPTTSAT